MSFERPLVGFFIALFASITFHPSGEVVHAQQAAATGGFLDSATGAGLRPRLSAAEIQTFLPQRGAFTFPSPYLTEGIRLTNASDCNGADCVLPVGYSYWSNTNNHTGSDTVLVFVGLARNKGGSGPTLFGYNKNTGQTSNLGPIFPADSPHSWSTGEGWYFSATRRTTLYLNSGPRMLRYDVQARVFDTVFDVTAQFGADKYIWQMHSSNDDRVHSATLRQNGTWEMLGCVAHNEATGETAFYAKRGDFDECQIDKSGRWLLIKENVDSLNGEDNRIIDLQNGSERLLLDPNGAAGHSDIGFGSMVAEDNFNNQPGAVRRWDFGLDVQGGQPASVASQGELVYQLASWSSGLGHVAYGNAQAGVPIDQQMACASNASRQNLPRVNEIVCFRLDGSLDTLVVAPNLTDLNASGGGSEDYFKLPKGNIDVTGEYFVWTANAGTGRLDAFLVRVPKEMLGVGDGGQPPPPPPPPPPADTAGPTVAVTSPAANATVSGTVTISANASDASGIAGVTFALDGTGLGAEDTTAPYSATWNTQTTPNGTHTLSALARDTAGNTSISTLSVTVQNTTNMPSAIAVQWTNRVNVTASSNSLRKTGGCGGCADAGAISKQKIRSGNGFMSFIASETATLRFVGLGSGSAGTTAAEIKYALRLQNGRAEVREAGAYRSEVAFASGDTLKIAVEQGQVKYSRNGVVFYTSAVAPSYPLLVDTSLYDLNATIANVMTTGK